MFFIEDNILWVKIQTKGEPTRVCVVIPQNQIQEILKDDHGALFNGHEDQIQPHQEVLVALYGQGHCRVFSKL
jgi:hypothetical protein